MRGATRLTPPSDGGTQGQEEGRNKTIEVWEKKTTSADNHYLDCEVYAAFAADYLGVRYLKRMPSPPSPPELAVQTARPRSIKAVGYEEVTTNE
ncbi:terminase gpA endonuclease subunit [Paenibacillus melissococcoides]|uniref:terminase gpA endonuclease subunit n=1 Tax=Paenibacillus melissococcoides TaxID=2912268 RepID=UPI00290573C5|nr:terminase gpA endonuclease subunit [Paenibacillus melissococcoides]